MLIAAIQTLGKEKPKKELAMSGDKAMTRKNLIWKISPRNADLKPKSLANCWMMSPLASLK